MRKAPEVTMAYLMDFAGVLIAIIAVFLGAYAIPEGSIVLALASAFLMLAALWVYFRRALLGMSVQKQDVRDCADSSEGER
jgi:hypothetical protein